MDALVTRRQRDAAAKAAQRKRRKAGLEEVRALVNITKLVSWLVWDGRLSEEDAGDPDKIKRALEDHLRDMYEPPADPPPRYASGSLGREYVGTRDRQKEVIGLLEREGSCGWQSRPTRLVISKHTAALCKIISPPQSPCEPTDSPPGAWMFDDRGDLGQPSARLPVEPTKGWPPPYQVPQYAYAKEEPEPPLDDYDPEIDVEESSADMSDSTIADCFDTEGYERD